VNTAGNRLDAAVALTTRLPGTLAALDRGDIDPIRARIVADATALLSAAHARQVEERVLVRAPVQNASQLRAAVRRAVLAVDPDGAEQRHERSVADRQVRAHPLDDGMAELGVYAAAPDVAAAYAHVDRLARAARTAGDVRTLDQLCTDVVLDLLSGRTTPTASTAQIHVTVAVTTLLGLDDQPAELRGYGPISAGVARKIAADGVWRRLLTDPVSGTLLDYGRSTYRARDALADHVRTRDVTCVFPGCRRPASACDLDHNLAYHEGGPTSHDNLGPLCRHHHRCKQQHGWTLTQPQPGTFIWTTPTGRQYTRPPEALGEPDRRSARDRPPRPLPLRA
jgi:hypothetical protein